MKRWDGERHWWPPIAWKNISSAQNAELLLVKIFGQLDVLSGGVWQSGGYMRSLFKGMLRMVPKDLPVKRILLLGLGAGSGLKPIFRKFPQAHVVALEYDQTMIDLSRSWGISSVPGHQVEICRGDLVETLPTLSGQFDLILVDVFCGSRVSPVVTRLDVRAQLERVLSWRGAILVNWFSQSRELSPEFEQSFTLHRLRRVKENKVGLYRRPGMGKPGEPLPSGYRDREESLFVLKALVSKSKHKELLSSDGQTGVRLRLGPVVIDRFCSKDEPRLHPESDVVRIIFWQAYEHQTQWRQIPDPLHSQLLKGVAVLNDQDYHIHWQSQARRHRASFLSQQEYSIQRVELQTFAHAFHATRALDPMTRSTFINILKYHLNFYPEHVFLEVVKRQKDGLVVSGLATVDYPDIGLSTHVIAFTHPKAKIHCAGVGLIDAWHKRCLLADLKYLNFGVLRRPGIDPRSWQGYTNFKRQFHLHEIQLPRRGFAIVRPNRVL